VEEERTLAGTGHARILVHRSRFLAYAAPVDDREALAAFLQQVRQRHPGARHVPYAWVAPDGAVRSSDDGEPPGTGGRPCLAALEGRQLRRAAVAVARLFGGVLLGAANLGRAYRDAAEAAVEAAGVVERPVLRWLTLSVPYRELDRAERILAQAGARVERRSYFGDRAVLGAWVPAALAGELRRAWPAGDG
jgi:putative IMPACT (imprinted ancient) family translation regulator